MRSFKIPLILLILAIGFIFRIYRFDSPIADWHEWRQADTSSVSRNFALFGFDILHPKFDDLSNVPSGLDNPKGFRFVEFPIYNILQAGLYKIFKTLSLEEWGRTVTIFSSALSTLFIYLIVKRKAGKKAALISSFLFAALPYSIYYGRVILPDPMMVAAIMGGIFFFDSFLNSPNKKLKWIFFALSLILTSSSFLLKPYALFFTLPIVYIAFEKFGLSILKKWYLWFFLIASLAPLIFWRAWIAQFPAGIPASDWLFNQGNIRFKPSFFYWIFADRLARLILGYFGISLFVMGFLAKIKKENVIFFLTFIASSLLYLSIFAAGNVQHDYYQILILPTVVIFAGLGGQFMLDHDTSRFIKYPLFIVILFFTLFLGWYNVRDYFNINNPSIVTAGKIIDSQTPKDAKIIAIYNGDTAFLYQTKRKGWASLEKDLPQMVGMGADFLALVNPTPSDSYFKKDYKVVYSSDKLLLYDLHQKP